MKIINSEIPDFNYNKIKTPKKQIVIDLSKRKDSNQLIRLKHKEFGKTKQWNMYTITRNGEIIKHFDDEYYSNFMKKINTDKKLISVVLENMCFLEKINDDKYVNWLNETCSTDRVFEKKWLGKNYWEIIDNKQLKSLVWLCNKMCLKHGIPNNVIGFSHYHKDANKFNGIIFKSNLIENGVMYNPSIDINEFNDMLLKNK